MTAMDVDGPSSGQQLDPCIDEVLGWITDQEFYRDAPQQPNYAVGLTRQVMIISKVRGLTNAAAGMRELADMVRQKTWFVALVGVYLAKTFGGGTSDLNASNHAEMCVLAAADAMSDPLLQIKCTGDNCSACYTMLRDAGVRTGNGEAAGGQMGWVHPRGPMALGTQLGRDGWQQQIAKLHDYNMTADRDAFEFGPTMQLHADPQGRYEELEWR